MSNVSDLPNDTTRKRDPAAPKRAIRKQPYCSRCFRTKNLHAHHVVAFADGGADDESNLSVLCSRCHREWHVEYEGEARYEAFLDIPPANLVQKFRRATEPIVGEISERTVEVIFMQYKTWLAIYYAREGVKGIENLHREAVERLGVFG